MARPKKNVTAPADVVEEVKTEAVQAAEEAAPAAEKKAAAKKPAAKKTAAAAKKPAAKKEAAATEENIIIQQYGAEVTASELIAKAKADAGVKAAKEINIYVRPEINRVYYVIDGKKFGDFELC